MRIAICDDEPVFLQAAEEKVRACLKARGLESVVCCFSDGASFLSYEKELDIVFMDIDLGDENGMDLIARYRESHRSINILLTSHAEEMANGYKVGVFRFLLKPISDQAFEEAFDAALQELSRSRRFLVRNENAEKLIWEDEILYIEAGDKCTGIRTEDGFYKSDFTITSIWEELNSGDFYMPHRSYIVNLNAVSSIQNGYIYLNNQEIIKVSRLKWNDFRKKYYDFVRKKALHGR